MTQRNWKPSPASRREPLDSFELAAAWNAGVRARQSLASEDTVIRMMWGVDLQDDFIWGSLPVPGGEAALGRFVEWGYDNVHTITRITASADDHMYNQIFHPAAWMDQDGNHPDPLVTGPLVITMADIRAGKWIPLLDQEWQMRYVFRLEQAGKVLVIWPYHCIRGTKGSSLAPAWIEFMTFWAGARNAQYNHTLKGSFWGSEMYAPQEALVPHPSDPNAKLVRLYDELVDVDQIMAGGLAENYCFDEWARANISEFSTRAPEVLRRFTFNREFTAPITAIPGWEDRLRAQYALYQQHGITVENLNLNNL